MMPYYFEGIILKIINNEILMNLSYADISCKWTPLLGPEGVRLREV